MKFVFNIEIKEDATDYEVKITGYQERRFDRLSEVKEYINEYLDSTFEE